MISVTLLPCYSHASALLPHKLSQARTLVTGTHTFSSFSRALGDRRAQRTARAGRLSARLRRLSWLNRVVCTHDVLLTARKYGTCDACWLATNRENVINNS